MERKLKICYYKLLEIQLHLQLYSDNIYLNGSSNEYTERTLAMYIYVLKIMFTEDKKGGGHDRRHPLLVLYEDINQKLTKYLEFT